MVFKDGGLEPFRKSKGFRTAYTSFWQGVVSELHAGDLLYDGFAVDKVVSLALALSCSTIRAFRLAGTMTADVLVTAWVAVQRQLAEA